MADYKWSNPADWLEDQLEQLADKGDIRALLSFVKTIINLIDFDMIQDNYQEEMTRDGYFNPIDAVTCSECGESFTKAYIVDPERHMTIDRELPVCLDCHLTWLGFDNVRCPGCSRKQGGSDEDDQ